MLKTLIIIIVILFSAFFSGSETALISANLTRLEVLKKKGVRGADLAFRMLLQPEKYMITLLVGNNLVVVVYSALMVLFLKDKLPESALMLVSTFILLLFGEIFPKSYFQQQGNRWIHIIALMLLPLHWLLYPISFLFAHISTFIMRVLHIAPEPDQTILGRHDITHYLRMGTHQGIIEADKSHTIHRILNLETQRVREVMVPRIDIIALPVSESIKNVKNKFEETGFSRLLIYSEDINNIIGTVHAKEMFTNPPSLKAICRDIKTVPESKTCHEMLAEFRISRSSIAVVIDEHGSIAGLITLEDVLEELVGDIKDEHDEQEQLFIELPDGSWKIHARLPVADANDRLNFNLPEGDYTTIGGLLMTQTGEIPKSGDIIEIRDWTVTILNSTRRQVNWVQFIPKSLDHTD